MSLRSWIRLGVSAKFMVPVSAVTVVLFVIVATVQINTTNGLLTKQLDGFAAGIRNEATIEKQLLSDGLRRKGDSVASLLANSGSLFLVTNDYTGLADFATSATQDRRRRVVRLLRQGPQTAHAGAERRGRHLELPSSRNGSCWTAIRWVRCDWAYGSTASTGRCARSQQREQSMVAVARAEQDTACRSALWGQCDSLQYRRCSCCAASHGAWLRGESSDRSAAWWPG